jgi:lactoylglutathione lyase
MRFLHTMIRISNIEQALDFFCNKLGLKELRRREDEKGRYTLIFLAPPGPPGQPEIELTFNWDPEVYGEGRNFGHLAYEVDDIYATCSRLQERGVAILRPPRDGKMAFVRSPDQVSVELLQKGDALPPQEPWVSMPNQGEW